MKCSTCGRKYVADRQTCVYCGASANGQTMSPKSIVINEKTPMVISDGSGKDVPPTHLPEHIQHKIEDALQKGEDQATVTEEHAMLDYSSTDTGEVMNALPLDKMLSVLEGMKDSLESGLIQKNVYERMVIDFIKDYILTLDEHFRLRFVAHGLESYGLSGYLNAEMLKEINTFVINLSQ